MRILLNKENDEIFFYISRCEIKTNKIMNLNSKIKVKTTSLKITIYVYGKRKNIIAQVAIIFNYYYLYYNSIKYNDRFYKIS